MSAENAQRTADNALKLCAGYESLLDNTDPESLISRINSSGGSPISADSNTLELIEKAVYYSQLSEGVFDPTIGGLTALWDFHDSRAILPEDEAIQRALKTVDYRGVIISQNSVCLFDADSRLDLGAIAKGYIADRLCDYLRDNSVSSAIVNLGGNVCVIGQKGDRPFTVGVETPYSDRTEVSCRIKAANETVVTSGVYERYIEVGENKYHHVLSPSTGYPADTDLLSVTVRSHLGNSADCDALSTICLIKGSEKALELIESLPGYEAFMICRNGEQLSTSGFFSTK